MQKKKEKEKEGEIILFFKDGDDPDENWRCTCLYMKD